MSFILRMCNQPAKKICLKTLKHKAAENSYGIFEALKAELLKVFGAPKSEILWDFVGFLLHQNSLNFDSVRGL